jgi:hypothetical protein
VSQPNRATVNAKDCLPVLDKALCVLTGLTELLLDRVIVGRHRREHESKKSKKRNPPRQGKATEGTPIARGTRSASAHIALSHAIHHSNFTEGRFGHVPVRSNPGDSRLEFLRGKRLNAPKHLTN